MRVRYYKIKNKETRIGLKRFVKRKKRERKKKNKKENIKKIVSSFEKKFKFLLSKKYKIERIKNIEKYILKAPTIFSLRKNFKDSIDYISDIAMLVYCNKLKNLKKVTIDLSMCKEYELAASCILDSVMDELKRILKKRNIQIEVLIPNKEKGIALKNIVTTSFINSIGMYNKNIPAEEAREMFVEQENIKFVDFNKTSTKECAVVTTKIVDMIFPIDKKYDEYKSSLGFIIGEIVDNVMEHAEGENTWYIVGNVIPKDNNQGSTMRLAIMNYGVTISQNLKKFMTSDKIYELQKEFLEVAKKSNELIKRKKIFGTEKFDEEQAYTYLAIQQGISSKIKSEENKEKRGTGIYTLNKELRKIADFSDEEKSNFTLISGETMINFKNKYEYKLNNDFGMELYQINFNKNNSINEAQDIECIKKLAYNIPCTILYFDFEFKEELVSE